MNRAPSPSPPLPLDYRAPSELAQQLSSFYHCCWLRFLPQQLGICGLRPGLGASPLCLRIEAAASSTGSLLNAYLIFKKCPHPLQPSGLLAALKSLSVLFFETLWPSLALNSWHSYLSLPSTGITGVKEPLCGAAERDLDSHSSQTPCHMALSSYLCLPSPSLSVKWEQRMVKPVGEAGEGPGG